MLDFKDDSLFDDSPNEPFHFIHSPANPDAVLNPLDFLDDTEEVSEDAVRLDEFLDSASEDSENKPEDLSQWLK